MCQFFSALYTRTGDLLWHWVTDHHSELMMIYGLSDEREQHFVRVEFTPPQGEDAIDSSKWSFRLDENRTPGWFDDDAKNSCVGKLQTLIKAHIINEARNVIADGLWVLGPNANVNRIFAGRIALIVGKPTINDAGSSTINYAGYSTIKHAGYSTINYAGYSTIKHAGYSTIKHAGYSTISYAGYSTIKHAGYSTIKNAGYSTINDAGSSTINDAGSSTINYAGYSTINDAGYSTIKHAGFSTISYAGSSTINDAGYCTLAGKKHKAGKPVEA